MHDFNPKPLFFGMDRLFSILRYPRQNFSDDKYTHQRVLSPRVPCMQALQVPRQVGVGERQNPDFCHSGLVNKTPSHQYAKIANI